MILKKIKQLFGLDKNVSRKEKKKVGTVRFFNYKRGYGFIRSKQLIKDVFIHISEAQDSVRVGDKVRFKLETTEKGYIAKNVELVHE